MRAQVGSAEQEHECWQRPEDAEGLRPVYHVNATLPGTDLAGEVTAALAAGERRKGLAW